MSIPKGYKLVPVEPTEYQMKIARSMTMQQEQTVGAEYRAMVKAAPPPPQPIYDEAKERELFQQSVQDKAERFQRDFKRYGLHSAAEYRDANMQWAWELWSIRAKAGEVGHE